MPEVPCLQVARVRAVCVALPRFDKRLKLMCVRALKRVFLMCDADGDGALNDAELNTFQLVCYGAALSDEELQTVKQVWLSEKCRAAHAALWLVVW